MTLLKALFQGLEYSCGFEGVSTHVFDSQAMPYHNGQLSSARAYVCLVFEERHYGSYY